MNLNYGQHICFILLLYVDLYIEKDHLRNRTMQYKMMNMFHYYLKGCSLFFWHITSDSSESPDKNYNSQSWPLQCCGRLHQWQLACQIFCFFLKRSHFSARNVWVIAKIDHSFFFHPPNIVISQVNCNFWTLTTQSPHLSYEKIILHFFSFISLFYPSDSLSGHISFSNLQDIKLPFLKFKCHDRAALGHVLCHLVAQQTT